MIAGGDELLLQRLDAIFAPFASSDRPGLTVGIARHDRAIYRKGFGLASIEHGVVNTPATRMRIGSTSKHFTCLGVLLLEEEGKLRLDDSVRKYLPELPELAGTPTLRQLMSHTAGYRCSLDAGFIADGMAIKPVGEGLAVQVRQSDINFRPGAAMIYSNGGYHLLSLIIARRSGMRFEEFLAKRIFEPLGMYDTESVPSDFEIHRGMATLHVPTAGGRYRRGIFPSEEVLGSGAMVSTIDDMLIWLAHLRGDKRVGGSESWRQLLTKARLDDGEELEYCLGIVRTDYRGMEVIHHGGAMIGGTCQMITVPSRALDIIIMTNGAATRPSELSYAVIDAVAGEEGLKPAPERLAVRGNEVLLGQYRTSRSNLLFEIADVDGKVALSVIRMPAIPLRKTGNVLHLLFSESGMGPYRIEIPELKTGGRADDLEFYNCGEKEKLKRISSDEAPRTEELAGELQGGFFCADLDASSSITLEAGRLLLNIHGHYGGSILELTPVAKDLMSLQFADGREDVPLRGMINLHRDGVRVDSFVINTVRTRSLRFVRVRESTAPRNSRIPVGNSPSMSIRSR